MGKIERKTPLRSKDEKSLVVLLKEAQNKFGYVPQELMAELARRNGLSLSDIYVVATFYSFISTKPLGRNVIKICKSVPCYLKNCETIIKSVEQETGIKPGQTTADGRFTLQLVNCIGACDKAPAMMINNDVHVDLTPSKISRILKGYK